MIRKIMLIFIVLGFVFVGNMPAQITTNEENFTSLFNGENLNGWVTVGTPGSFTIKGNTICTTGAHPYPSWLRTEKEYGNFVLRFSYKTAPWYEGGILIHAPLDGPGTKIGFKVHLRHDRHALGKRSTGAIYDVAAPDTFANFPAGQWNQCEVVCDWPVLRVKINGVAIHNIDMGKNEMLKHKMRRGYIGIQNICNGKAYYKDIRVRPLPDKEQWTDVFASGIDGLELTGNSQWLMQGKTLTARGNNAIAYTKKEYPGPFEMQVWVKNMVNGNGGIIFGNKAKEKESRVEIQCFNVEGSTNPTGSIYDIAPATRIVSSDMEWYLIQIFSRGKSVKVFVNGEKVAETDKLKNPLGGIIGFQQHTPNGYIQYRDARIKIK